MGVFRETRPAAGDVRSDEHGVEHRRIHALPDLTNPKEKFLSNSLMTLVVDMTKTNPVERPTMPEVQRRFKLMLAQERGSAFTNIILKFKLSIF